MLCDYKAHIYIFFPFLQKNKQKIEIAISKPID